MAKKSIGIVELHIEKVVLGAALLFLLAVMFMYLVSTPNSATFDEKALGPGQLDPEVRQRAEELALKLRSTNQDPNDRPLAPDWMKQVEGFDRGPIKSNELASTMVPVVPWGLPVPKFEQEPGAQPIPSGGRIELASVESPNQPKVRFERRRGRLASEPNAVRSPQGARPGAEKAAAEEDKDLREEDINLVIIETQFNQAGQKELLQTAYRDPNADVTYAAVEVQRRLVAGDRVENWEDIEPYADSPRPIPPKLELIGEGVLSAKSRKAFDDYFDQLHNANVQVSILVPHPPAPLEEAKGRPREEAKPREPLTPRPRRSLPIRPGGARAPEYAPGEQRRTEAGEKAKPLHFDTVDQANKFIKETLPKAQKALDDEKLEEAAELAQKVLDAQKLQPGSATVSQENQAKKILAKAKGERGETTPAPRDERIIPIRQFDLTGEPGRTYQYRVRVGILNELCMVPRRLKDPNQATQAVIYSNWSEPSEPVTVQEDMFFYLAGEETGGQPHGARVDVFKWYLGRWILATFKVLPGEEIGSKKSVPVDITGKNDWYREEVDFFTGAVAVDLTLRVPQQPLVPDGKAYRLADYTVQTTSLIYMDDDGLLHERLASIDTADPHYKKLREMVEASRPPADKKIKPPKEVKKQEVKPPSRAGGRRSSRGGYSRQSGGYGGAQRRN
jgi:hypothetical protein